MYTLHTQLHEDMAQFQGRKTRMGVLCKCKDPQLTVVTQYSVVMLAESNASPFPVASHNTTDLL
jgi:hypothetical protein